MSALAIARANLVRFLRDRSNLLPMLAVPIVFVFLIGTQFGGGEDRPTLGIRGTGPLAAAVAAALEAGGAVDVATYDDAGALRDAVAGGAIAIGAIVPDDARARLDAGEDLEVEVVDRGDGGTIGLRSLLVDALEEQALVPGVATALAGRPGAPPAAEVRAVVEAEAAALDRTAVAVVDAAGEVVAPTGDRFSEGAAQQLVLMVFLFTLFSALPMIQSRTLGLTRRMLATPTGIPTIVAGEAGGRWLIALVQGAWILVATSVLFDVRWGSLPLAVAVLVAFGAVGAGAGMLLGALVDDEGAVLGVAMLVGLSLGALGGAMLPGELLSGTVQALSRGTPHAWALDALATVRDGGGLADIAVPLTVLAAAAAVLVALASWRLRVVLTRA